MEIITLSGTVQECTVLTDKNGHNYVVFKLFCERKWNGRLKYSYYRCYTYNLDYESLEKGDTVFLSGDIDINVRIDRNGRPWLNSDVYVKHITKAENVKNEGAKAETKQ